MRMTGVRNMSRIAAAVAALACGTALAAAMTKEEYKAANARIDAEYQADRQKCGDRHGNVADLCIARAHGARKVARAELEATYKPGPLTNYDAAIARADAAYVIAKEECDDRKDAVRKACVKDAEVTRAQAKAEAKAIRAAR